MKTILHFANQDELNTLPNNILSTAHLVTYGVPCLNSEYTDRVMVYKNRAGNQNICISQEQLSILQDCVLNDKPQPEFMKTQAQKAQDVINRLKEKDNTASFYKARLAKMEGDLFPSGYVDCPGLISYPYDKIEDRFSRIEKILGVVQSPCGISLERLENCEFYLKNIYWRLSKLDNAIYPTQKDVDCMQPVITLAGRVKRLEDKLGINLAFTDLNRSLQHIENVWNCVNLAIDNKKCNVSKFKVGDTIVLGDAEYIIDYYCNDKHVYHLHRDLNVFSGSKEFVEINFKLKETPYVCPVLIKHQQALQDALQDKFGKTQPVAWQG